MTEELRHEIVQRHQAGASIRLIARDLGISRGAVVRVLRRIQAQREGRPALATGPRPRPPKSIVDPFEPILKELLAKYPNLTVERAWQELRARGYTGGYTVVRERVRLLRPRPAPAPVPRFETSEGMQAQMDFGVYDIDFTREGRRRVYLFSYLLGYSRRQYLRWVESMDLLTTLREHVHAFHPGQRTLLLQQRFGELGPIAVQFLDGLLAKQIQGKLQAQHLLALVARYQRDDVLKALERAVRFGAFSFAAMRRILAATAKPKPLLDELAELYKDALDPSLRDEPIGPRPTSDYQHLLSPKEAAVPRKTKRPTQRLRTCVIRSSPTSRLCASL